MPDFPDDERTSTRWARMSMERKLPLLIGIFLLFATAAISLAGYVEVRHSAISAAEDRAASLTMQIRDRLAQQVVDLRERTTALSTNADIVSFAESAGPARPARALEALRRAAGGNNVLSAQIRSTDGRVLLSSDPVTVASTFDALPGADIGPEALLGDSVHFGRFQAQGDSAVYPLAAPIPGEPDKFVVVWRRLNMSPDARQNFNDLLGTNAAIQLGNADGSMWTDMVRLTAAPAERLAATTTPQMYAHGPENTEYLLSTAMVEGTPWMVAVDMPMSVVLAPVSHYMRQMALVALVIMLVGLFMARRATREISAPLTQLTTAATAIARGDYSHDVRIAREDELGRLGDAFGTMAEEVQQARVALETKVDERTRDLKHTVAQLHETQDALVRRERLAMLGQLASGVGHELRNPLGVMTNAVYYLRATLGGSPDHVKEYLTILEEQVTLSEKIVADLLDFARSKPPTRSPASLEEIVTTQLARLNPAPSVSVSVRMATNLPLVLVDATQAGQIILNLLTNAVQAMDSAGMLSVHAQSGAGEVRLDIADSGPGVAPENVEKVFEPLFTTKARGIGLGLALSRTFARANGGDVTVTSEVGRGAVFHLTLPAVPAELT